MGGETAGVVVGVLVGVAPRVSVGVGGRMKLGDPVGAGADGVGGGGGIAAVVTNGVAVGGGGLLTGVVGGGEGGEKRPGTVPFSTALGLVGLGVARGVGAGVTAGKVAVGAGAGATAGATAGTYTQGCAADGATIAAEAKQCHEIASILTTRAVRIYSYAVQKL